VSRPTIYLDHNATTPVDRTVIDEMLPWMTDRFWNASSTHTVGRQALLATEAARGAIADLVGVRPREIVFTSGATEANNTIIKGALGLGNGRRTRVIVGATEHTSVLEAASASCGRGDLSVIPVNSCGLIDEDAILQALDESVALVSVMLANNETGVVAPLARLSKAAHAVGAVVHSDITQAAGRIPVDLPALGVDVASLSAHKMYGPKGVGTLVVRKGVQLDPLLHGGGHERGLRSGTLNVPGVVGMAAAARLAADCLMRETTRQSELVEQLVAQVSARLPGTYLIGSTVERLPNTACIRFQDADAEAVMVNAPTLAISAGSACTSLVPGPSHVLQAMGLDMVAASECLRFSVGRLTDAQQIKEAVELVVAAVERVRELTSGAAP
jgi:cysteine desulfurase